MVLSRRCSLWPLAMQQFVVWSDLDHELSSRLDVKERRTETGSCVLHVNTASVNISQNIQSTVLFELTRRLLQEHKKDNCVFD